MKVIDEQGMAGRVRVMSAEAACTSPCLNLKKAARAASHILDESLQSVGLRASQFSLPNTIALSGATTLTRNLKPLGGRDWCRSSPVKDGVYGRSASR